MVSVFEKADRKGKTALVEATIQRNDKGVYLIKHDNNTFEELYQRFRSTTKKEEKSGVIFEVAKTRCGSAADLTEAVAAGRVVKETKDNCDWYIFKSYIKTEEEGTRDSGATRGNKKLSLKDAQQFREVLAGIGWKSELTKKETQKADKNDDQVAAKVIEQLRESQVIMNNLLKESLSVLDKMKTNNMQTHRDNPMQKLQTSSKALKLSINHFEDALTFEQDEHGETLTNAAAFRILAAGGVALTDALDVAETGKALIKIAKGRHQ
jgi:hypothetical protein